MDIQKLKDDANSSKLSWANFFGVPASSLKPSDKPTVTIRHKLPKTKWNVDVMRYKKISLVINGDEVTFEVDEIIDRVAPGFDDEGPLLVAMRGGERVVIRPKVV